jgi:hypothetical protein
MQNWKDLYTELSEILTGEIPAIKWVDLWHNQVNFLDDEHPFPAPAVFLSFRILETADAGQKVQQVKLQVDTYIFYETMADSYFGSWNQASALDFLELINSIYSVLHGSEGENFSSMRRTGFAPIDTGGSGNLYLQSFECLLIDYAAQKLYEDATIADVEIENKKGPEEIPSEPLYKVG